jgi:TRAP-type mannitol/chloroaromatic compound transport system substrate-binding protein
MTRKPSVPALPQVRGEAGSRRKFLKVATGAVAAGATLGFPMISKGQAGPISMRFQSTWPTKDIFHEYALDYAKTVNDMTGGDLKIEVLPAGAVVPAFRIARRGVEGARSTAAHGVLVYHYGKQNALALWGSGPAFGMDANMLMSWHRWGGGQGAPDQALQLGGRQCRVVPVRTDGDTAARLVQEADHQGRRSQGPQVPHGRHLDRHVHGDGLAVNALPGGEIIPAMDRGLLDAAEFNNMSSDRVLGFPDVSKVCMLQSFHQNAEQFEISFNKTKYDALPEKEKAIIANAGGTRRRRTCRGRRSTAIRRTTSRCRPRTRSGSSRRRMRS